jgi:hypothetical protein
MGRIICSTRGAKGVSHESPGLTLRNFRFYNFDIMRQGLASNPYLRILALSIAIIVSLTLVVPFFIGCGGSKTAASNCFIELLNLVPADAASGASPVYFALIDHASLYKDTGITFSTPEEIFDKVYKDPLTQSATSGSSFITGYGQYAFSSTIRKEYVGYDATDIDAEIQFGIPPTNGVAAIGRFSPQTTADALNNRAEWPSWAITDYSAEDYRGITIHSWGSGFETHFTTRLCPPHVDELGRARPLAVSDKYLFYAPSVEAVKLMIDASQDKYSSLADLPEYASIANGLSDLKAYSAIIGDESQANGSPENIINDTAPRLKKFLTFGTGLGRDEKGFYTALVLYHESSANARDNVSLLKQRIENTVSIMSGDPWKDLISDTEIQVEGNVLLAKLHTDYVSVWASWFYSQDTLLLHEQ